MGLPYTLQRSFSSLPVKFTALLAQGLQRLHQDLQGPLITQDTCKNGDECLHFYFRCCRARGMHI